MMTRALLMKALVSLFLGAAIVALALGSRSFTGAGLAADRPFILYRLTLSDAHLAVVHVRGAVFGSLARRVSLGPFTGATVKPLDPISFQARGPRGEELPCHAADGAWIVESGGRDFSFEYDVPLAIEDRYSGDVRDMMTFVGIDRCRILGRDVFLLPDVPLADGIAVDVAMGPGRRLAASSPCVGDRIIVPDVAELPLTMVASGDYRSFTKNVGASEIALAIADTWSFADSELFDVVCRIVSEEIAIFGSAPRERYLFICDRNPVLGGSRFDYYGIHYGGSMILLLDRRLDRSELMDTPMAIIAHEFFHNWNGDALGASGDEFLWFTEGVTNYFSYHVLRKANVITNGQYMSRRRAVYERYQANPYAGTVSIGEAGNSDMRDKDMVNLLYDGGFLVAEALEARLRAESGGKVTLIDVLKRMYQRAHGSGPVDEASFVAAAGELVGSDLSAYVRALVHTSGPKAFAPGSYPLE